MKEVNLRVCGKENEVSGCSFVPLLLELKESDVHYEFYPNLEVNALLPKRWPFV